MKNAVTESLIDSLYQKSREENSRLWRAIAKEISSSRRRLTEVNLAKLSKLTKPREWVIVPGKVLGSGEITHQLNVVALSFSATALEKLKQNGNPFTMAEFIKKSIKPKGLRIIK